MLKNAKEHLRTLENAEKGLNMLFEGKNTGKMIVKL